MLRGRNHAARRRCGVLAGGADERSAPGLADDVAPRRRTDRYSSTDFRPCAIVCRGREEQGSIRGSNQAALFATPAVTGPMGRDLSGMWGTSPLGVPITRAALWSSLKFRKS